LSRAATSASTSSCSCNGWLPCHRKPEFIVAILFAVHGKGSDAIGTLISSKVNQWTPLVGSLPLAYLLGGGGTALALDARQVEEFLLTATQTLLGVAALLALRFPRWLAVTLLALFALQFAFPGQQARYLLSAVYAALALGALIHNRHHILPTLAAPFRRSPNATTKKPLSTDTPPSSEGASHGIAVAPYPRIPGQPQRPATHREGSTEASQAREPAETP
jgi:hypothetical protein